MCTSHQMIMSQRLRGMDSTKATLNCTIYCFLMICFVCSKYSVTYKFPHHYSMYDIQTGTKLNGMNLTRNVC